MPKTSVVQFFSTFGSLDSFHFTSVTVAVVSGQLSVSSSTAWNNWNLPSNFVNGCVSTMWLWSAIVLIRKQLIGQSR